VFVKDFSKYVSSIPVIPEVATKIMGIAEDKLNISFKELENIIKIDPGLTSKILKVANSALYARQSDITSLQIAITLLGFKNIKSLVILVTASSFYLKDRRTDFYKNFWRHSIITAFLGKEMALRASKKDIAETIFIGGLLHNIGQALLFNLDKKKYDEVLTAEKENADFIEVYEENVFGINHRQVGAEVFRNWTFPEVYTDIVLEHDSLHITSAHKTTILYVTVASLITESAGFGMFNSKKEELLKKLAPHISLTDEDLVNYKEHILEILKADSLFSECRTLFGLE
jgi:putative nucleotidyltransferase with HDIG domain